MRQVFLEKGRVSLHNVDVPLVNKNDVLVRVYYSFISSGTEVATIENSRKSLIKKFSNNLSQNTQKVLGAVKENGFSGTLSLIKGKMKQVLPLGYSCSGEVIAIGCNVKNFKRGDFVACAGSDVAHHADVVAVPENLVAKIKHKENLKHTSLTTIGAIALQGIRRAKLEIGEKVCVLGLGLIGQMTAQLAKLAGCQVFGVDLEEDRLTLAKKLGTDCVFNPQEEDFVNSITVASSRHGVDTTIITAGAASGKIIEQAMQITRRKGKVILVGNVKLDFDREIFYSKEIDLLISCSYGPGRYDHAYEKEGHDYPYPYVRWTENRNMQLFAHLIEEKKIDIAPLVSYEFNVQKVKKAYASLQQKDTLGVLLSYKLTEEKEFLERIIKDTKHVANDREDKPYKAPEKSIQTAVIGAGGFCKIRLLPIISSIKTVNIHAVIDTNATNLINVARSYDAQKTSNDFHKLVGDDDVHAVVIATPHVFHTEQAIKFMQMGKAVFVEKPAAVTFEQLEQLKAYHAKAPGSFYCVDFNRSFSPFMGAIKKLLDQRANPLIVHYRMNAGFIPQDHWIQSDANKGRIIGEACHIFELFCFLTDSNPVMVSVSPVYSQEKDMSVTDNFLASVTMDDGSCCSLLYTALGNSSMGKEDMEVFFDGKSIIMNDFLELKSYGLKLACNKKVQTADKGHERLLKQFFEEAKKPNGKSPIPFARIAMATELTLTVDKLARAGGGMEHISGV